MRSMFPWIDVSHISGTFNTVVSLVNIMCHHVLLIQGPTVNVVSICAYLFSRQTFFFFR